jgi:hypothetical protein
VAAAESATQNDAAACGRGNDATAGVTQQIQSAAISVFKILNVLTYLNHRCCITSAEPSPLVIYYYYYFDLCHCSVL